MLVLFRIFLLALIFSGNAIAEDVFDSQSFDPQDEKPPESAEIFDVLEEDDTKNYAKGKIIIMNKITASSKEFDVEIGKTIRFGKASLALHKCANSHNRGSSMFVTLDVEEQKTPNKLIFRGWLFSKSQSLSAVTHPVYQLIAVSCS